MSQINGSYRVGWIRDVGPIMHILFWAQSSWGTYDQICVVKITVDSCILPHILGPKSFPMHPVKS